MAASRWWRGQTASVEARASQEGRMSYRIGMIPYANMGPYRACTLPSGFETVPTTPTEATRALSNGGVLAGAVPVGDLPSLRGRVDYVGTFGIAAEGAVASVLLFSRLRLTRLVAPARVFLTEQSSSSVRLLSLLLRERNGVEGLPYRTTDRRAADAELLIGDDALKQAAVNGRPFVYDLAEEWSAMTGLPMVFARWVVRMDADREAKHALDCWLRTFAEREAECVRDAAAAEGARLGVPRTDMLSYLNGMRRVLTDRDLAGQDLFLRKLRESSVGPLFRTEGDARP